MLPSTSIGSARGLIDLLHAHSGIVCLVGAGGKKSTIYRLVSEFTGRVAITSTVFTPPFRKRLAAHTLIAAKENLQDQILSLNNHRVIAYACPSDKKARLAGVDPDLVTQIHQSAGFDLTLVKADGARLRWLKAPAEHEPALPPHSTTLIPVISIQAVAKRLDQQVAHRPEQIAALINAQVGDKITPQHLARLLIHSRGGLKHYDRVKQVVPVINMVDSGEQKRLARLTAEHALEYSEQVDKIVLTSMTADDPVVEVIER